MSALRGIGNRQEENLMNAGRENNQVFFFLISKILQDRGIEHGGGPIQALAVG